jgi:hypothetical protein
MLYPTSATVSLECRSDLLYHVVPLLVFKILGLHIRVRIMAHSCCIYHVTQGQAEARGPRRLSRVRSKYHESRGQVIDSTHSHRRYTIGEWSVTSLPSHPLPYQLPHSTAHRPCIPPTRASRLSYFPLSSFSATLKFTRSSSIERQL